MEEMNDKAACQQCHFRNITNLVKGSLMELIYTDYFKSYYLQKARMTKFGGFFVETLYVRTYIEPKGLNRQENKSRPVALVLPKLKEDQIEHPLVVGSLQTLFGCECLSSSTHGLLGVAPMFTHQKQRSVGISY